MQARAHAAGVELRPHAKTHKSPEVGAAAAGRGSARTDPRRRRRRPRSSRLSASTTSSSAIPVFGADKARRLLALSDRVRLAVGVDSLEGARSLGGVFHAAGRRLPVRLKIDSRLPPRRRPPENGRRDRDADRGPARASSSPDVFTHGGQGYAGRDSRGRRAQRRREGRVVAETARAHPRGGPARRRRLARLDADRACRDVRKRRHRVPPRDLRLQRLLAGRARQRGARGLRPDDSRHGRQRPRAGPRRLDAGSKTLSSRPPPSPAGGHGLVLGRRARIARLSEEHGVIAVEPGESLPRRETRPDPAQPRLHRVNLHDRLVAVRGGRVEGPITVDAPRLRPVELDCRPGSDNGTERRPSRWHRRTTLPRSSSPLAAVVAARRLLAADTYTVDKNHSDVSFQIRHFASKVRGRFADFEGTIQADPAKPELSSVVFTIKTASIDTNNADRDKHLRSADFFDADEVPRDLVQEHEDHADREGQVRRDRDAHDALRLEGRDAPGHVPRLGKDPRATSGRASSSSTKLNRKDFGINWNKAPRRRRLDASDDVDVDDQPRDRQEGAREPAREVSGRHPAGRQSDAASGRVPDLEPRAA